MRAWHCLMTESHCVVSSKQIVLSGSSIKKTNPGIGFVEAKRF